MLWKDFKVCSFYEEPLIRSCYKEMNIILKSTIQQ